MYPIVTDPKQMVWYKADQAVFKDIKFREGVSVQEVTEKNVDIIQQCIDLFTSEIQWEGMFDMNEALDRFSTHKRMFVLLDKSQVLGHVWFDDGYLFNMFVSQKRTKGDAEDFCHYTCRLINKEITLFSVKDNIRGQKFFEKVGFTKS